MQVRTGNTIRNIVAAILVATFFWSCTGSDSRTFSCTGTGTGSRSCSFSRTSSRTFSRTFSRTSSRTSSRPSSRGNNIEWGSRIVVCGGSEIQIIDAAKSGAKEGQATAEDTTVIVWRIDASELAAQLPDEYRGYMIAFDECKPVGNGRKLLVCSSSHCTLLIDTLTRKVEFHAFTPMAHSAEYIPIDCHKSKCRESLRGRIVVANSTDPHGNSLELYDIAESEKCIWRDSMYFAHGVVWSERYQTLYALGFDELRSYSLKDWKTASPSLELTQAIPLPGVRGHDLTAIDKHHLLLTLGDSAWVFDMKDNSFTEFALLAGKHNVKSANYDPRSGRLIYTQSPSRDQWWTDEVKIQGESQRSILVDHDLFCYKVRVIE